MSANEGDRGFGKWSQRGIPHKGWTCINIYDLEHDRVTCEMCESAEIRYVHVMTHPQFSGELEVGCICAGHMEQDLARAEGREKEFKRRQNPRVAYAMIWLEAALEIIANAGDLTPRGALFGGRGKLGPCEYDLVCDVLNRAKHCTQPRVRREFFIYADHVVEFRDIYRRIVGRDHPYIAKQAEPCEKKLAEERAERERGRADNELGVRICDTLLGKPLYDREREFVASTKQQIFGDRFQLSERQRDWLKDIWRRYGLIKTDVKEPTDVH
jgi:hypothetical protein